jgi:hypothetical protein
MRRSQVSLLFNFPALRNPDRDLSGMARGALTSSFPSSLMLPIRERQGDRLLHGRAASPRASRSCCAKLSFVRPR